MNQLDTMDPSTLIPAALIVALAVLAIFGTLAFLFVRSRMRKAQAATWLAGVYGAWTGTEDSATWARDRAQRRPLRGAGR